MGEKGYRTPMHESQTDRHPDPVALVDRYFEMVAKGDPEIGSLFADDACWVTPQSSPMGQRHEGKAAVLALMGGGVGLYDAESPLEIERTALAASGDHVFVELTLSARTGQGEAYSNQYVFVFRFREGLIVEVHEHLDTLYAQRKLFDPAGMQSPLGPQPSRPSQTSQ